MQHMKIQIGPIKFFLSNGIWFAYIRWPPGLALKLKPKPVQAKLNAPRDGITHSTIMSSQQKVT